LHLRAV